MVHVAVDLNGCPVHAQKFMKDIGASYRFAIPQSVYDSWWFLDCKNLPDKDEWPSFMKEFSMSDDEVENWAGASV